MGNICLLQRILMKTGVDTLDSFNILKLLFDHLLWILLIV